MCNKKNIYCIGTRAQVMHGNAKITGGGLKKKDLKYNKRGKIVSKKASAIAKKEKRLQKAGYKTKKGEFTLFSKQIGGKYQLFEEYFYLQIEYLLEDRTEKLLQCLAILRQDGENKAKAILMNRDTKTNLKASSFLYDRYDSSKSVIAILNDMNPEKKQEQIIQYVKKRLTDFITFISNSFKLTPNNKSLDNITNLKQKITRLYNYINTKLSRHFMDRNNKALHPLAIHWFGRSVAPNHLEENRWVNKKKAFSQTHYYNDKHGWILK